MTIVGDHSKMEKMHIRGHNDQRCDQKQAMPLDKDSDSLVQQEGEWPKMQKHVGQNGNNIY